MPHPPEPNPTDGSPAAGGSRDSAPSANQPLRFSWRAFLLAPWPAALVGAALLTPWSTGRLPLAAFAILLIPAAGIAFAGTFALVVCTWLLRHRRPITRLQSMILGGVLAAMGSVPFLYLSWSSSGPNSGPPEESFRSYAWREARDPLILLFLGAGMVTALLYVVLGRKPKVEGADVAAEGGRSAMVQPPAGATVSPRPGEKPRRRE